MAAGPLMAQGEVDVVLVGADRIAANGDTANKIGTYTLAVLARRHAVPFYVCVPLSSVDLETPNGAAIPIEDRPAAEVTEIRGTRIAPAGTPVRNPAFDITPAELITAFVTDEGVLEPPFEASLRAAMKRRGARRAADKPYAIEPAPAEAL
jgi:methylthioribose-1-phosphate isomerase